MAKYVVRLYMSGRETEVPARREQEMGACNFIEFGEGKTAKDAFNVLVSEAIYDYGHDPYNGTISTTTLSRRATKTMQKTWGPRAEKKAVEHAKRDNWGEKWESRVLDCGRVKGKRGVHMWAFYGWAAC